MTRQRRNRHGWHSRTQGVHTARFASLDADSLATCIRFVTPAIQQHVVSQQRLVTNALTALMLLLTFFYWFEGGATKALKKPYGGAFGASLVPFSHFDLHFANIA